mgnify:CR=1 FL=1
MKLSITTAAALCLFSSATFASSYDFTTVASGTAVTTQYSGVSFSLGGGGATSGNPIVQNGGITNSNSGYYPTADWLVADFDTAVSKVSFTFDNEGDNSYDGGSEWRAYGASGLLGSGSLASASGDLFNLTFTGITQLVWDNNLTSRTSWIFDLDSISFTPEVSAVPVPAAAFLFAPALLGFMGLRRKAKNSVA